ncbi:MAG: purD, partial [Solimicrobium sp.]|nr:purD [Solimicrobium sp.]
VLEQAVNGRLDEVELEWDRRTALGVVMASAGYPDAPVKGTLITGIPLETDDCVVFHAGTRLDRGNLTVSGGRVVCAVGLGDNIKVAQKYAYDAVDAIQFNGSQARRDIGWRAIKNSK